MRVSWTWLAAAFALVACGDDGAVDPAPATTVTGGGDGIVRPPGNGVRITEDDACASLRDAYNTRRQELCGVSTVQTCPNFVRINYDPDCVEFDEGSVQGCVDVYEAAETCDDLPTPAICEAATFPDSPACP